MARPKPLFDYISSCLGPAVAARGFATADVLTAWPEIIGERLAEVSKPIRMEWRRGPRQDPEARAAPATLVIGVEGSFALEIQHLAPLVIERINARYGWRCVGRIVLKQGPVRRSAARRPPAPPPLSEERRARIADAVASVREDALREALERLGRAVAAETQPGAGARTT